MGQLHPYSRGNTYNWRQAVVQRSPSHMFQHADLTEGGFPHSPPDVERLVFNALMFLQLLSIIKQFPQIHLAR